VWKLLGVGLAVILVAGSASGMTTAQRAPGQLAFWKKMQGLGTADDGILVTSDGGRTWRTALATRRHVVWVAVTGDRFAWAIVGSGSHRRLLASSDGGRRWSLRTRRGVFGVSFADARHGFAVTSGDSEAENQHVFSSNDGGRTWRKNRFTCHFRSLFAPIAVARVSTARGWVLCAGEPGTGSQAKGIFITVDGGATWHPRGVVVWQKRHTPARNGLSGSGYVSDIAFDRSGSGLLPTYRGVQYRTRDGGSHWRVIRGFRLDEDYGTGCSMYSRTGGYLLVLRPGPNGVRPELDRTADAGRHWSLVRRWAR
jgi:photosystem II stability/assembly factor-like uncharacterized protein